MMLDFNTVTGTTKEELLRVYSVEQAISSGVMPENLIEQAKRIETYIKTGEIADGK